MKTMFLAAIAAVSLGTIGSAYAGDGDGTIADTRFTEIPGVVAQAPAQKPVATAQNGQATQTYASESNRTNWVFPPIGKYLAQ
jgi:hypothetical protein